MCSNTTSTAIHWPQHHQPPTNTCQHPKHPHRLVHAEMNSSNASSQWNDRLPCVSGFVGGDFGGGFSCVFFVPWIIFWLPKGIPYLFEDAWRNLTLWRMSKSKCSLDLKHISNHIQILPEFIMYALFIHFRAVGPIYRPWSRQLPTAHPPCHPIDSRAPCNPWRLSWILESDDKQKIPRCLGRSADFQELDGLTKNLP